MDKEKVFKTMKDIGGGIGKVVGFVASAAINLLASSSQSMEYKLNDYSKKIQPYRENYNSLTDEQKRKIEEFDEKKAKIDEFNAWF